jgi:hypothetical protein
MKPDSGKRSLMALIPPLIALVLIIALIIALFHFTSPAFLKSIAIAQTNRAINGTTRLQSIAYVFPAGAQVTGFKMIPEGDSVPAISIDRLWVRLSLVPLLFRKVSMPVVHARGVLVAYLPVRKPMIADLFVPSPLPPAKHPWSVSIDALVLDDVSFRYADTALSGIAVSVRDISLSGSLAKTSKLRCTVRASHGSFSIGQETCLIDTVAASAFITESSTVIDSCLVGIAGGLRLRGSAALPYQPGSLFAADIRAKAENFSCPLAPLQRYDVSTGDCAVSAHLSGHYSHPAVSVDLRAENPRFRGVSLRTTTARATLTAEGVARCSLQVDDPRLTGTVSGRIAFGSRAGDTSRTPYSFRSELSSPMPFTILRECGVPVADLSAAAQITLSASGTSLRRLPDSLASVIVLQRIQYKERNLPSAECRLSLVNGLLSMSITNDQAFSLSGSGHLTRNSGTISADFYITDATVVSAPFLVPPVAGSGKGAVRLSFHQRSLQGEASFSSSDLAWNRLIADSLSINLGFTQKEALVQSSYAHINGPLDGLADALSARISGLIDATVSSHGRLPLPATEASVRLAHASIAGFSVDSARMQAVYADSVLQLTIESIQRKKSSIAGTAWWSIATNTGNSDLTISAIDSAGKIAQGTVGAFARLGRRSIDSLTIHAQQLPVSAFCSWIDSLPECAGVLDADIRASGPFTNPEGSADIRLHNPTLQGWSAAQAHASARLLDSTVAGQCTLAVTTNGSPIFLDAMVPLSPANRWRMRPEPRPRIHARTSNFALTALNGKLSQSVRMTGEMGFDLWLFERNGAWVPKGSLDIDRAFVSYAPLDLSIDSATVHVYAPGPDSSPVDSLQASFAVATRAVRRAGQAIDMTRIAGRLSYSTITIDTGMLGYRTGRIAVTGSVPLRPSPSLISDHRFRLSVQTDSFPLSLLSGFIADIGLTGGTISGTGTIAGREGFLPLLQGGFSVRNAIVNVDDMQPAVGPLQAAITLRNDTIIFAPVTGRWGAGRLQAHGWFALLDSTGSSYALYAQGTAIPIIFGDDIQIAIDSLQLELASARPRPLLSGKIVLGSSSVYHRVSIAGFAVPAPLLPDTGGFNPDLEVRIRIPDSLATEVDIGQGFAATVSRINAVVGGAMSVSGTLKRPGYSGEIAVVQGKATFLGKEFTITEGAARLPGGNEINPSISVSARTALRTPGSESPEDTIAIILSISGELQKPVIQLSSEPGGYTQAEIISLLTFGSTSPLASGEGGQIGNRASDFVSQSLSAFATQEAQKLLGLEQLSIRGNIFGDTANPTEITASKKIGKRITLTYSGGVSTPGNQRAIISWQILPFLFLEGESDIRGNVSAVLSVRLKR